MRFFYFTLISVLYNGCTVITSMNSNKGDDTEFLVAEIKRAKANDTIILAAKTYNVRSFVVDKKIIIKGNGSKIKAIPTADKNVGISLSNQAEFEGITLDGVWIAFKTEGVKKGILKNCSFVNQTYSNINVTDGADNVVVSKCRFTGKAMGIDKKSSFPCLQITTGSRNVLFEDNICTDVVAGVTADGINRLINNVIVRNNVFDGLKYYALKTDVGNVFKFDKNTVKNAQYGVFYEAYDSEGKYSKVSGNGLVIENNQFEKVNCCLYVAGKNPNTEVSFGYNVMQNCEYAVNRSCGKLYIYNNRFVGGKALYYYFDAPVEGDIFIEKNFISATRTDKEVQKDWDGIEIKGSIVIGSGKFQNMGNIHIKRNNFEDWQGSAIQVARIANMYISLDVKDNTFNIKKPDDMILKVGSAERVKLEGNTFIGQRVSLSNLIYLNASRVSNIDLTDEKIK